MSSNAPSSVTPSPTPVRVLYIIDQLCEMGGAERTLVNILRLLPKDRFRCSLLTFRINPQLDIFASFPCPYEVLPLRRTYDWGALQVALQIRRRIRDEQISIVHTFFETSDLWAAPLAKMSGCQAVVSSRRDMGILRSKMHRVAYRVMNPVFDVVLAVSEAVRQFCIQNDHLPPRKVLTVYNGLELEKIPRRNGTGSLRATMGLDPSAPIIVTVGHVRRVKGFDVLVRAAAKVLLKNPKAIFLIVGRTLEPEFFQELHEMMVKMGVEKNIRFLGNSEEVFSLLKACNIFFLPSRSEGFSNALIEAMACGLPCIATRVGGNAEAIEDGRTGYIVENEDSETAADRILTLLNDPALANRMGEAGREVVERRFTTDAMMGHLVECYDRVLSDGRE